jgi:superoxide dismutase, Cu-Zn family
MMKKTGTGLAVAALALVGACDQKQAPTEEVRDYAPTEPAPTIHSAHEAPTTACRFAVDPGAPEKKAVTRAIATLHPTKGNDVVGTVAFEEQPGGGLKVTTDVNGLAPGKHAYHIHVLGNCSSPDAKSAGPHFAFEGSSLSKAHQHITGDLGDLVANEARTAKADTTVQKATLQGPYSILGRSVVIHQKPNDPSKPPDGAAGPRLACGVIGVEDPDVPKD